ncbi:MAG: FAD binding domain-containing protein [Desulfobacteraceae bacterium]|nr:FAD binding domain-containing protein [Desulfobacteraceae bacterium]
MQNYQFHGPRTVGEALNILSERGDGCRIIAGGTDLIPALRNEDILPDSVLNILEIDELTGISEEGDTIRIGPTTTFTEIIQSQVIKRSLPLLVEAASSVGGPTIRNRGTIGGNICNGSPAADVLPAVVALDGELELQSKALGTRIIPAAEAVEAPYQTRFNRDELLTGILIKKLPSETRYAFEKLASRNAMARAYMNISIVLKLDEKGAFSDLRIVPGTLEAVARRMSAAEKILMGRQPEDSLVEEAADAFVGDLAGVWIPDYKLPVARSVFKRVLKRALNGSGVE